MFKELNNYNHCYNFEARFQITSCTVSSYSCQITFAKTRMLFIINNFSMINAQIIMKCFFRADWHSSTSRHEMTYMDRRMVQLTDRHTFQDFQDNMLHDVNFSTKRPYVVEVLVLIDNSLYQK